MKIGITGSTGILGRISVRLLTEKGYELSLFKGDIRDPEAVSFWLRQDSMDVILHYAAMVPTNQVKKDPLTAYQVNVGGTMALLSEIIKMGQNPWLFYASSCHVYKSKDTPISEEDEIAPVSLYGMTKYMGEQICMDSSNFPICAGRIFSFYHETQKKPFLYPTITERLQTEDLSKPFFLYGADGQRDFLHAEEVVKMILGLMRMRATGIFNIGSGKAISIRDFVQNLAPQPLNIDTNDEKTILVANVDKIMTLFEGNGYDPKKW